jgi:rhodanese-related sulfurtransferase
LRRAGLVTSRKVGTSVIYALASPEVLTLVRALRRVAEQNLAEVGRIVQHFYHARDNLEPVSRDEMRKRLRKNSVLVLDVRPLDEYTAGHVPGAVSLPVSELKRRLKEIPKGREIVACCRGPYCVYSYDAVEILRKAGFAARRLDGGFVEWKLAGLPLVSEARPSAG